MQSPLCQKVAIVTRRNVPELANPKVQQLEITYPTAFASVVLAASVTICLHDR